MLTRRVSFARNIRLGLLLENFLVSSVASLLIIRFYLALTGFPQIGGHGLHIAHMLWGGLFMLTTIVLLLSFLGRRIQNAAAILGGIGFGTFIDELGKFITSNVNYFYQPTIALIYIIFILLFLVFRAIERAKFSEREVLANALDAAKEVVLGQRRAADYDQTLQSLRQLDAADPMVAAITAIIAIGQRDMVAPRRRDQLLAPLQHRYHQLAQSRPFLLFIGGIIGYAVVVAGLVVVGFQATDRRLSDSNADFVQISLIASAGMTALLLIIGSVKLVSSRRDAAIWYKRGVLVNVLVTQIFLFYIQQLDAIVCPAFNLIVLSLMNYTIRMMYQDTPGFPLRQRRLPLRPRLRKGRWGHEGQDALRRARGSRSTGQRAVPGWVWFSAAARESRRCNASPG